MIALQLETVPGIVSSITGGQLDELGVNGCFCIKQSVITQS